MSPAGGWPAHSGRGREFTVSRRLPAHGPGRQKQIRTVQPFGLHRLRRLPGDTGGSTRSAAGPDAGRPEDERDASAIRRRGRSARTGTDSRGVRAAWPSHTPFLVYCVFHLLCGLHGGSSVRYLARAGPWPRGSPRCWRRRPRKLVYAGDGSCSPGRPRRGVSMYLATRPGYHPRGNPGIVRLACSWSNCAQPPSRGRTVSHAIAPAAARKLGRSARNKRRTTGGEDRRLSLHHLASCPRRAVLNTAID